MTAHTSPPRPETERRRSLVRPVLLTLLISVTVTGAAWLGAVYAAPESFEVPLAWGAGGAAVVLCAALGTAVHGIGRSRRLQALLAAAEQDAVRLADETLPALVEQLREGASAESALAAAAPPGDTPQHRVLRTLADEVGRSEAGRAAATAACANAAGRMQALATSMLADLREMEHRHSDENMLADLLRLDHRTAQAGRLADSIAVLTGARSGRRWAKPIVMESILRGAMGRIGGYQRVRLHCAVGVTVAGHAAEGVMHALAELLDNAANFSPPTAEVHVYVEEVPAGVIVTVEDSGLVMSEVALRRAERAVSREHPLDLTTLSGTRLGLAVVGCLARKHGLSVSFRPSARGGTGALMLIPHELIGHPRPADDEGPLPDEPPRATARPAAPALAPARPPAPGPHEAGGREAAPEHAHGHGATPADAAFPGAPPTHTGRIDAGPTHADVAYGGSGLPKRQRGRALAAAHPEGVPAHERRDPAPSGRSLQDSAERFRAFRNAVRGADATPRPHPGPRSGAPDSGGEATPAAIQIAPPPPPPREDERP